MNICICLESEKCIDPTHRMHTDCHPYCETVGHNTPLGDNRASREDKYLLAELDRICQHLATYLPTNRLYLAFVCDCAVYGLAVEAMKSLLLLPRLRWCSKSLSQSFNAKLRELAETTRLLLTDYPESRIKTEISLRDLPKELQMKILRHTGLVAPYHLYYCSKSRVWKLNSNENGGCFYDSLSLEYSMKPICCRRHHDHSLSGWNCNCWHFPTALLSVDRKMRNEAQEIAFRENTWIFGTRDMTRIVTVSPLTSSIFFDNIRDLTIDLRLRPRHASWVPPWEQQWSQFVRM